MRAWILEDVARNESGKVTRALGNLAEAEARFQGSYAIKVEFGDG